MLDAQQRIRDFNFLTEQYLRCVRSETDQAQLGKDAATREQLMSERIVAHNAAQAKLMGYANCFNEQLRAFKASGGGSGALAADCSAQLAGAAAGSESNAASAGLLHAPLQVPRSRLGSTLVCERTM
ncbi:MAG TPA: hypothetical protein VJS42_03280 [Steroidobacteraceae bacterium]|nr:hypothetical protein [Steroidobacteraceae bacterium]